VLKAAPKSTDVGLLVLRLALGMILLFHGVAKLQHGVAWIQQPLATLGLPGALAYGTYLAEIVAPVLLIVGAWTRIASAVIVVDLTMAIVLVLRPRLFAINPMGGGWAIELEGLILAVALALCLMGGGRYRVGPMPCEGSTSCLTLPAWTGYRADPEGCGSMWHRMPCQPFIVSRAVIMVLSNSTGLPMYAFPSSSAAVDPLAIADGVKAETMPGRGPFRWRGSA
jgi:putative oxidoreductase